MKKLEKAERGYGKQHHNSSYHIHLKKYGRRIMRRLGKLLLDDAPRKLPMRGWEY